MSKSRQITASTRGRLTHGAAVVAITLAASLGGYAWHARVAREIRAAAIRELNAVSELVSRELVQWRLERIGDGVVIGRDPSSAVLVDTALRHPDEAARAALRARLESLVAYRQYGAAVIVSMEGNAVVQEPRSAAPFPDSVRADVRRILGRGRPDLIDFYLSEPEGRAYLALVVPAGRGGIVLRIDPDAFLHPLLEAWPGKSETAEVILLRRDGADALVLTNLRFLPKAALRQRIPLERGNVLAVRAVLGGFGVAEGLDYLGQPSLGVLRSVPDSPWFLVARIQDTETDGEARRWLWPVLLSVGLIVLSGGLALAALEFSQRARFGAKESALLSVLQESEQRLRLALKATRQGLIDIDVASGAAVVNREYAELHGQDPSTFVETAEAWASRLHPDERERAVRAFSDYLAGKTDTYRSEVRQRVGSEWRWILTHGEIVERNPDGSPKRFIGTATDVSDLKTAQLQAQSSARLYAALSLCNEAIVRSRDEAELYPLVCQAAVQSGAVTMAWIGVADPRTALLDKVARYGGGLEYVDRIQISVSADSPLGRGPTGTCMRENRPIWVSAFREHETTGPWHEAAAPFGWRASAALPLRQNGTAIGALTLYSTTSDDFSEVDRQLLTQMADDITFALEGFARERQREAAERALQESEQRYRTLFHDSRVVLLLIDPGSGSIVDANAAAGAFYGWPDAALRGMNIGDINTLTPAEIGARMEEARASGQGHFDFRHRTAGGAILDVEVYSGTVRLNGRELLLSTVIDVTERRRAQERLEVSEASLRDSLREKEALLKEVHQRVKNNLQVINSLMRLEAGRSTDGVVKAVLGTMQSRILSMAVLHETLYRSDNLARIDLGGYLTQLAQQAIRSMSVTHVSLELDMAPLLVDIEQAVPCGLLANELLSNSLKHGFPGRRAGVIRMSLRAEGDAASVVLDISDDGVGLPPDWETRRQSSLGLQLVFDLARQLQGVLTAEPGPGARFKLRFTPHPTREGVA